MNKTLWTMQISLSILLVLTMMLITVSCAPKLGYILFDPLAFESEKTVTRATDSIKTKVEHEINRKMPVDLSDDDLIQTYDNPIENIESFKHPNNMSMNIITISTRENNKTMQLEPVNLRNKSLIKTEANTNINKSRATYQPLLLQKLLRDYSKSLDSEAEDNETESSETSLQPNVTLYHGYEFDGFLCKSTNRIRCGYNKNKGLLPNPEDFIDIGDGCRIRNDRIECGYLDPPFKSLRRPSAFNRQIKFLKEGTELRSSEIVTPVGLMRGTGNHSDLPVETNSEVVKPVESTSESESLVPVASGSDLAKRRTTVAHVTKCVEINDRMVCYFW